MTKQKKIAMLPVNIASTFDLLNKEARSRGYDSTIIVFEKNKYNDFADKYLWESDSSFILKEFLRIKYLFLLSFKYDIYHYCFATTIANPIYPRNRRSEIRYRLRILLYWYHYGLQYIELKIIRTRKCKIFVHYVGDDARLFENVSKKLPKLLDQVEFGYYSPESDKAIKRNIRRFDKFADVIYAMNPDLLSSLPPRTKFLTYANIKFVDKEFKQINDKTEILKIVHAPTDRRLKGTEYLVKAVNNLISKGMRIDLEIIENVDRERVLSEIENSNLVVDQLLIGWYGGITVEAWSLGKPVMVFVDETQLLRGITPEAKEIPIINVNLENIESVLSEIYFNRTLLKDIQHKIPEYLEKWHNSRKITNLVLDDYAK